jgi:hypothetical protein
MPTLLCQPRRQSWALSVLLALAMIAAWPGASAHAATLSFVPAFSPSQFLGEGSSMAAQFTFTGSEYHGSPDPVTEVVVHLPAGVGGTDAGFPTCPESVLSALNGPGTAGCPAGSLAGPLGSIGLDIEEGYSLDGSIVSHREHETGTVQPVFANEEETGDNLLFYVEAQGFDYAVPAHYREGAPPYGRELILELPLIESLPGQPYASITSLTLTLGASREEDGQIINSLTIPQECPVSGKFPWEADVTYTTGPSFSEQTHAHTTAETTCPASSGKLATTTTLQASSASPHVDEVVTYTATVTPKAPGASPPSGSIAFLDEAKSITGCTAQALTPGSTSSTASCQLSYPASSTHHITARYGGDTGDFSSESTVQTITVSTAEPQPKEEPPHKESPSTTPNSNPTSNGPSPTAIISSVQIAALLGQQLVPSGKTATIPALLKDGGLTMSFKALEAGTLAVGWYEVPAGAKLAKRTKAKPVLVASGQMTFSAAGTGKLKVRLTAAGRKLLKHAKQLKLTVEGVFAPGSGASVSVTKGYVVR